MPVVLSTLEIVTNEYGEKVAVVHAHNPNYAIQIICTIAAIFVITELISLFFSLRKKKRLRELADKIEKRHEQIESEKECDRIKKAREINV